MDVLHGHEDVMRLPDIDSVTDTLRVTAAEEILPRFRRLGRGDVRQKGPGDPVTVVDEAAEARLSEALTALLPGSVVVAEEIAAREPSVLDRLKGDAPVWIIDPLDGTNNFTQGRARFAVIVALVQGGRTFAGWIHDPVNAVTATAVAGQGAWLGDRRLALGPAAPVSDMEGLFVIPHDPGWRRDATMRLTKATRSRRRIDCAGAEYIDLASGRGDFAIFYRLNPWDHAAGVLIYREAGGHAALLDRRPYAPTIHMGPMLLAPTPDAWDDLRAILAPPE